MKKLIFIVSSLALSTSLVAGDLESYLVDPEKSIFNHNSSFYNPHSTTIAKATDKG